MKRARLVWALLCATPVACLPRAQAQAQARESGRWDALGRMVQSAREAGVSVSRGDGSPRGAVDGPPRGALWIQDAEAAPTPNAVLEFARAGGQVLIADERPAAAPLLSALGFRLGPPPDETLERVGGHPALVAAQPTPALRAPGVSRVIANLPARLEPTPDVQTLLEFADGTALMQRRALGRGVVWALADGSTCIDLMLESDENARFCAALVALLTQEGQRPLRVYGLNAGDTPDTQPEASLGDDLVERAGLARDTVNEAIADLSRPLPPEAWVRAMVALCVAVAIVLAAARFPGLRVGRRVHGPRRRAIPPPQSTTPKTSPR